MSGIVKIKEEKVELSITLPHARQLITSLEKIKSKDDAIVHFIDWLKRHTHDTKVRRDLRYEKMRANAKKVDV